MDVCKMIVESAVADGNTITLTCGQLPKPVYAKVDQIFTRFRGKWKGGKSQCHIFPAPITGQIVLDSITAGQIPPINPYDLFPTPAPVIDSLMSELRYRFPDPDEDLVFLEPSGGTGAIASRLRAEYPNARIDVIEIDPVNVRILEAAGFSPVQADFTKYKTGTRYDAVVMNPPFNGNEYVKHINHALSLVNDGGIVISVAPASVLWRTESEVRQLLALVHERGEVVELPAKAFKESGAGNIDTVYVTISGSAHTHYDCSGYANRKLHQLSITANSDRDVYAELVKLAKRFSRLTLDEYGHVTDPLFIREVTAVYTNFMNANPLSIYAILDDWEWVEMATDAANWIDLV